MKKVRFLLVLILTSLVMSAPLSQAASSKPSPSVAFFYGDLPPLQQLCEFDWVVLDPGAQFSPQDYCHSKSKLIAYVALGEVGRGVSYESLIKEEWILTRNKIWNNNIVIDQTQPGWKTFYLENVIAPLWEKGFRGFFFDTLDSYQLGVSDSAQQHEQLKAMESIIKEIRRRYPDAILILNQGYPMLPSLSKDINAVSVEGLYEDWNQAKHKYEATSPETQAYLFNEIKKIKALHLPVIVIDYLPAAEDSRVKQLRAKIRQQKMIPWVTNADLDSIY